ncbi:uncharacterized protein JCM6883_001947 [Sporobolomyces salmoneus]|uniref:uncharacterized protein n=1 Tax=Sporobolomyces salmoneus TaxID=183962 RepID=UPI003170CE10
MAEASTSTATPTPAPTITTTDQEPAPPAPRRDPLPGCYTVVWGRNSREEPNFIKLSHTFGDGDAARWPDEGPDMTLLGNEHDKQRQWRKTAGELLAKDLGHYNGENASHWMLADLPKGYALFQQVTHPKGEQLNKDGGAKRLRLDRFIYGHEGRKLRSAISLGKHVSWQIFGKNGPCPCDGCKVVGKAAEGGGGGGSPAVKGGGGAKKRKAGEGTEDAGEDSGDVSSATNKGARARPKLARTAASRAAARGKGKRKGKGRDWDDEEDDEDDIMYDEEDDDDGGYSSDYTTAGGTKTTSSGRQSKPSTKVGQQAQAQTQAQSTPTPYETPNDVFSEFMTPAPPDLASHASYISVEDVQRDLRFPTCPRVGELIWVRVPLARPPGSQRKYIGDADLSRWPGIVRARSFANIEKEQDVKFKVELLAQNPSDALEGVKIENTLPWIQFVPANTAHMDRFLWSWEQFNKEGKKKGWGDIQAEGWPSVVGSYWRAHRIAKCFAAIQIRSLPTISVGTHLAAPPGVLATTRSLLKQMPPQSRFLTHSHVLYGPELVHVGDFVRLAPGSDLGPTIDRSGYDPEKKLLNMSLILHIQLIYRGGTGSPLMARGPIYEMVELPERNEEQYRNNARAFGPEISTSILKTMPRPFPHHKWRLASTRGEVDVLFGDIAGRYHALNRYVNEKLEIIDQVLARANQQVEKKEDMSQWSISKGGYGLNGHDALKLTLAGLEGESRTTRIIAENGAMGTRDDQLRIAEEQARAIPADPKLVGKPKPAAPADSKTSAAAKKGTPAGASQVTKPRSTGAGTASGTGKGAGAK